MRPHPDLNVKYNLGTTNYLRNLHLPLGAGSQVAFPRRINEIVLGKRAVTADTDLRLARYVGVSEGLFLGMQSDYELMEQRCKIGDKLEAIRPRAA